MSGGPVIDRRRVRSFMSSAQDRRKQREPVRVVVLLRATRAAPAAGTTGPTPVQRLARRSEESASMLEDLLGPCDEAALTTALALRGEASNPVQVTTVSASGVRDDAALIHSLARGADRALAVVDPALTVVDYHGVARVLAAAVKHAGFDLVLAGQTSLDEVQSVVGPAVAELLGIWHLSDMYQLTADPQVPTAVRGERRELDLVRTLRIPLPALVAVRCDERGPERDERRVVNAARGPGERSVEVLGLEDLGIAPQEIQHRDRFLGRTYPVRVQRNATMVRSARELVARLRDDRLI